MLAESNRKGPLTVGRQLQVNVVLGSVTLDLTEATFPSPRGRGQLHPVAGQHHHPRAARARPSGSRPPTCSATPRSSTSASPINGEPTIVVRGTNILGEISVRGPKKPSLWRTARSLSRRHGRTLRAPGVRVETALAELPVAAPADHADLRPDPLRHPRDPGRGCRLRPLVVCGDHLGSGGRHRRHPARPVERTCRSWGYVEREDDLYITHGVCSAAWSPCRTAGCSWSRSSPDRWSGPSGWPR